MSVPACNDDAVRPEKVKLLELVLSKLKHRNADIALLNKACELLNSCGFAIDHVVGGGGW